MGLILISVFVGNMVVTSYRSVPEQTDDTPFITSIGDHVCRDGIAVSQDLLKSKRLNYGDWVYIEEIGLKRINDTMHPRFKNHIDVWVKNYSDEKKFEQHFKGRKLKVWLVNFKGEVNEQPK